MTDSTIYILIILVKLVIKIEKEYLLPPMSARKRHPDGKPVARPLADARGSVTLAAQ
jgi:hypothetical protein